MNSISNNQNNGKNTELKNENNKGVIRLSEVTTRDEKDIPFNPKKMRLNDVLNTDYQVTDEELLDYEAVEASGNGEPLKLEEFKEFRNRREMQEELIKKEIAQRVGERGGTSYEATKEFKLYKIKFVRETIRKMMALYESHRCYLSDNQ
ncbi:MAG: hypothetical protein M3136_10550 [Thermoproteota archaeon]|nr:hypothetical protein [Thermoproteota archaeon]